jgi:glyoxylase-like metal-dependent hydrolase (beta-lactamase superfamily II)
MRLASVLGNSQKLDGGAMFGNCPKALWSRWCPPDSENRIDLACRALLVEDGSRLILAETGVGAYMDPATRQRYGVVEPQHVLLGSLEKLGVRPDDISHVVVSHLHFDHAGGLLTAYQPGEEPRLLFPRAQYLVGERALERATHPHPRDRASFIPGLVALLQDSGRLSLVAHPLDHPLGSGVRFRFSDGHTPGLMQLELVGERHVVFVSDLIPGTPWVNLAITMGYDRYPELLIEEKKALLEELLEDGGTLFYTHDPLLAASRVGRDEKGKLVATEPVETLTW